MANTVSNFLANALLNQVFRNQNYTRPTTVYIALYTSNPTGADTGTEVSGGGYARQSVALAAPITEGGKQTIKNSAEVSFPVATADWGLVSHIGIRDAATGGNLLYYGPWTNARTIQSSDVFKVATGSLVLTLN